MGVAGAQPLALFWLLVCITEEDTETLNCLMQRAVWSDIHQLGFRLYVEYLVDWGEEGFACKDALRCVLYSAHTFVEL